MGNVRQVFVVVLFIAVTLVVQVLASRIKWTVGGLILPILMFIFSVGMLAHNLHCIREGIAAVDTLTSFLHFALYNIPTILFLCIYNYYQRMRLAGLR